MSVWVWLLPILLILLPATHVQADELILEIRPEPGVVVRVIRQPNWQTSLRQPFGDDIAIPRPGGKQGLGLPPAEVHTTDINFDGYPDLAIHFPEATPADPLQIIRYLPAERRYETLHRPRAPAMLCDWRDAVPKPEQRRLALSCQRGLSHIKENVRFTAHGLPWLETRTIKIDQTLSHVYPYISMASQFSRWNEEGQEIEVEARDSLERPIYLTVPVPRTYVFEWPGQERQPDEYLVRGDRVRLLDWMPDWLRVSWDTDAGTLDRWLWIPAAFDLAAQIDSDANPGSTGLVLSAGKPATDDKTDTLATLFPIILTHHGLEPQTLDHPELHLLFSDREGWHVWTQSLHNRTSTVIEPGESRILEQGPPIVAEDSTYILPHPNPNEFETEIALFPFDLSPGKYHVRAALTSPGLDAPLYSAEHTFCHDPSGTRAIACMHANQPDDK